MNKKILLLVFLLIPFVMAEQQMIRSDVTIDIVSWENNNKSYFNFSIDSQGYEEEWNNLKYPFNLNQNIGIYSTAEIECNKTDIRKISEACMIYFNGTDYRNLYIGEKAAHQRVIDSFSNYQNDTLGFRTIDENLTKCKSDLITAKSDKRDSDGTLGKCTTDKDKEKKNKTLWGFGGIIIGAIGYGWYKSSKEPKSRERKEDYTGDYDPDRV